MWNWNNLRYKVLLPTIVIAILLLYNFLLPDSFESWRVSDVCRIQQEMKNTVFTGHLKDKYVDDDNHNTQTLNVSNNLIEVVQEQNGFFETVEIGDSLIKDNKSLKVAVFREDSSFSITLVYDCSE